MKWFPHEPQDYVIARRFPQSRDMALFAVAKFNGGEAPEKIYYVEVSPQTVTCTCPGWTRPEKPKRCRHMNMVALWVLNGDKDPAFLQRGETK